MATADEKKIELIAQLLAKAESTTPEEAEALTAAAEKMMLKYMIDQATIDARRAKQGNANEKIIELRLDYTGAYRGELVHLAFMVAQGLGSIRCMQNTGIRNGKTFAIWLVGFESDVKQAEQLIRSLEIQAAVAVREFWKTAKDDFKFYSSYEQEKERRSFVHGFGTGVNKRLRESRAEAVKAAGTGTELVLVNRSAKVDEYYNQKNLRSSRSRNATAGGASNGAGYVAGTKANTGGRSVSQGRGISA